MENLWPPFIISIYGKPASGKSHLMYILCCMRAEGKIDILFVFTSTKKNEFYDNMADPKFVMHYSEKLLAQFWKKAEAISHRGKNILLVFDNCISSVNWKSPIVEEVFSIPTGTIMSPSLLLPSTQTSYQHSYERPVYSSRQQDLHARWSMTHMVRTIGQ